MVNNAGSAAGGVIEHLTEDDWEKGLQLKFMGYVRCLRYVLPIMVKQGGGRVVNLIGNDGVKPSYWEICPGAANAAGQNLTLSLAGQYGKDGISFVAVNPGPVRTERWAGLVDAMARDMKIPREQADKLAPASIPMGRIAEVEEVANLVVMLASPLMQMVNGTMIEIDGGQDKPLMDRFRDRPRRIAPAQSVPRQTCARLGVDKARPTRYGLFAYKQVCRVGSHQNGAKS